MKCNISVGKEVGEREREREREREGLREADTHPLLCRWSIEDIVPSFSHNTEYKPMLQPNMKTGKMKWLQEFLLESMAKVVKPVMNLKQHRYLI